MTAPDTNTSQSAEADAREEALFRADIEFLQARIQFNEIQQKTITEEIHLNNDSIEVLVLESKAESLVSDTAHLEDVRHDVFEASTDVEAEPTSRFDHLSSEEDDLVARYHEFQSRPIEARDPAEAQALVEQMHDLVNQANAVHEDFVAEKQVVDAHIAEVKVEVEAVLDSHDAHAADSHDAGSSSGGAVEVHATVDHQAADQSSTDAHASEVTSELHGANGHDASVSESASTSGS